MRVDQPYPRNAPGAITPWSRPAPAREPIVAPTLRERAVGFGTGLVDRTIDYAIAGTVISVAGSGAVGELGGLIGAGAFAALSLLRAVGGAIRPSRYVEPHSTPASSATYQPVRPNVAPPESVGPGRTWLRIDVPTPAAIAQHDLTRTGLILASSTTACMVGMQAMEWPATWALALLPGLVITLTASVGLRRMLPGPT